MAGAYTCTCIWEMTGFIWTVPTTTTIWGAQTESTTKEMHQWLIMITKYINVSTLTSWWLVFWLPRWWGLRDWTAASPSDQDSCTPPRRRRRSPTRRWGRHSEQDVGKEPNKHYAWNIHTLQEIYIHCYSINIHVRGRESKRLRCVRDRRDNCSNARTNAGFQYTYVQSIAPINDRCNLPTEIG